MNSLTFKRLGALGLLLGLMLIAFSSAAAVKAQDTAPAAATVAGELKIYDWTKPVTKAHRGFPWDRPPKENGNWVSPVNYAGGMIHFRAQIFSQPKPQQMRLQFCFWQNKSKLETCSHTRRMTVGDTVTWSEPLNGMWQKNNRALNWAQPRDRNGVAIKNMRGKPVSNFAGWNWNGENPDDWYPLNMRFIAVVVAKGKTFSGWQNYVN